MLSIPFRLAANGGIAETADSSDQADTELLASLIWTRRGERVLLPTFGLPELVFGTGLESMELVRAVEEHGPDVTITGITVDRADEYGEAAVEVSWTNSVIGDSDAIA